MSPQNFKVDFIGIGASRSGTTWLARCLAEHPDIFIPKKKELGFFHDDFNYKKGLGWYEQHFASCQSKQIKGEFTPGYFVHKKAAGRIAEMFPDTKLILVLRNPIERAYSEYFYNKARKIEDASTFERALESGVLAQRYKRRGMYFENIQPFLKLFEKNQILILVYEDIEKDPVGFIQNVYEFLGVDTAFVPQQVSLYINMSPATEKNALHVPFLNTILISVRNSQDTLTRFLKKVFRVLRLTPLLYRVIANNYRYFGSSQKTKSEPKPPMKEETRARLIEFYKEDISALEKIMQRSLRNWR